MGCESADSPLGFLNTAPPGLMLFHFAKETVAEGSFLLKSSLSYLLMPIPGSKKGGSVQCRA